MEANDRELLNEDEKRELRRQRRVRNLILAYVGLAAAILLLVLGIFFGIRTLRRILNEKKQVQQMEEQLSLMEQESVMNQELTQEEIPVTDQQPSEAQVLEEVIASRISEMTLEEKVAGLFIVTPESITGVTTAIQAGEGTREALEKYPVGGIIYFAENIQSEEQIKEMLDKTVSYSRFPLFLAVDEEGGSVSRVADALKLENVGDMADIGATGDVNQAYTAMQTVGNYLAGYGFNLDFAPVADVLTNTDNKALEGRSFGSEGGLVSDMAAAAAKGLKDSGITACMKHFPGTGAAGEDTHNGLVLVEKSLEELQQTDLLPFIAGIEAGVPMIMVGHISLPEITGDNTPASMSSVVISDLLRGQLAFNGVVITDAMDMKAITEYYGADEAAVMAFRAGADMVLMPEDFELALEGVVTAVQDGTISEERINDSLTRVYRIKFADSVGNS